MKDNLVGYGASGVNWILVAIQNEEVLRYIELILAIISTFVALAYTIWKWYKKAKEDGKITKDEVKDLVEDIKEVTKDGDRD